jgi:anti-sigma factor RsiW
MSDWVMQSSQEMTCRELAQQITAYLERALAAPDRDRFEAHCLACPECRCYVAQWQAMLWALGRL